jgi:pimeloyl-ACP methyl ester carboxylesterase
MNERVARLLAGAYEGFERADITATDGYPLTSYECGPRHAPPVIIVNPIGVPIVIASRVARKLGERYRVTCWEQRGYRSEPQAFFAAAHDFAAFQSDLLNVVRQRATMPPIVIGFCSGAALAIRALAQNAFEASRLVLICPAVRFDNGYVPSIFDQAFVPYMRMISGGNHALGKQLLEMRAANLAERKDAAISDDDLLAEAADTASLQSLDSLMIYARTVKEFSDQRLDADLANVRRRVTVFAAVDDRTVSIQSVRQLCRLLQDAHLQEFARGGHYMAFLRGDVQDAICEAVNA